MERGKESRLFSDRLSIPIRRLLAAGVCVVCLMASLAVACAAESITLDRLKQRIEAECSSLRDLSMQITVKEKNKDALESVEPSSAQLYEFKVANVALKEPDKLRMEGKLGMVKFEYIVNNGIKIFRSPTVRINRRDDYSHSPAKLQDALDVGLITPSLWRYRTLEVIDCPEAEANGEIQLRLRYKGTESDYRIWIDSEHLWLKRLTKTSADGELKVKTVYSDPKHIDGIIWMPAKIVAYAPDGRLAGSAEVSEVEVNKGLKDSLFE